jgi:hypothetical protein
MKSELAKTGLFIMGSFALLAVAARFEPEATPSTIFSDAGELFFPEFRDPSKVAAIEVVGYDQEEAVARPLKVELRKGSYVITSHADYPAEAKDRMATTASSLVGLKKDSPVSDHWEDHAGYGVIDPLDTKNASLQGRGKRVTLKDAAGTTLADIVLGKSVPEKEGQRYVRLPGQKRVYAVKTAADPSAQFADWVEANLLRLRASDISKLTLNAYQVDEQFGRLMNMNRTVMTRGDASWNATANRIASTLASLRVTGARAKPPALADQLRKKQIEMTLETVMSLRQLGYFIAPNGALLANEGELIAETSSGLSYVLRFGEVVTDTTSAAAAAKPKENRYLFVTVSTKNPEAQRAADALDSKFADWYYIITGEDFTRLHPVSATRVSQQPQPPPLPGMPGPPPARQIPQNPVGEPRP